MQNRGSKRIAIVGAGLAGLAAAWRIHELEPEAQTVIFEKSRSLAGRCATRKWREHLVDHGAQYFTASKPPFQQFLGSLGDSIQPMHSPILSLEGEEFTTPHGERYYHARGNNCLGRAMLDQLGQPVELRQENEVRQVAHHDGSWTINGQRDESFGALMLTLPWPQTRLLLEQSHLLPSEAAVIRRFAPNLTGFLEYEGKPSGKAAEIYAQVDLTGDDSTEDLAWSACENHKEGRIQSGKTVFVVQAGLRFSLTHLESPADGWLPLLRAQLEELWELEHHRFIDSWGHRWRFARALDTGEEATPPRELAPGLFVAGDGRVKSRVEACWMDGREAGEAVISSAS